MGEKARILRALNETIQDVVGRLQLSVFQILTTETPVDTGFARGAWTPSLGTAQNAELVPPRRREAKKSAGERNLVANRAKAEAIARTYQISQGPVFISNNVPYIGFLNEGSSAQAPARFVEAAIAKALRSIR